MYLETGKSGKQFKKDLFIIVCHRGSFLKRREEARRGEEAKFFFRPSHARRREGGTFSSFYDFPKNKESPPGSAKRDHFSSSVAARLGMAVHGFAPPIKLLSDGSCITI